MKKLVVIVLIFLMAGCMAEPSDLQRMLEQSLEKQVLHPSGCIADNHKPLFSYYAEPSVGNRTSTQTSNVFLVDGVEVVMNLDISTVMNSKYYPDVFEEWKETEDELVFMKGKYIDCHKDEHEYVLSVYLLMNGKYYVDLKTHYVNFYSAMQYANIDNVIAQMIKISQTVEVNEAQIISVYSSKPADEHIREKVDLFQEQIAENGRLDELIGVGDSSVYEEDEPEVSDPVEDMPDVWIDELVPEE